jgi:hypothetical protein
VSFENENTPNNNIPPHLEQGLASFEDAENQLQIEVFGAERIANDAKNEASELETLELQRSILGLIPGEGAIGNNRLVHRSLQRRHLPPVGIYLVPESGDGLDTTDADHFLAGAPLRVKNLLHEQVYAPQKRVVRLLGVDPPLLFTASEDLYFDKEDKAWVVRTLTYPHKSLRNALKGSERETVWAVKPASRDDLEKATDLLVAAAHEDAKLRARTHTTASE